MIPDFKSPLQRRIYDFLQANPGSTPEQIAIGVNRTGRGILTSLSYMAQYSHHLVANAPSVDTLATAHHDAAGNLIGIASSDYLGFGEPYYAQTFPHSCVNPAHALIW